MVSIIPENFPLLKNKLPDLCADRIEYNLQGGFLRNLITREELAAIWDDLHIEDGNWILSSEKNAVTLAGASLIMTETLWGSPWESIINRMGAEAILHAIGKEIISFHDFHISNDNSVCTNLKMPTIPMWRKFFSI